MAVHDGLDVGLQHTPAGQVAVGGGHWQQVHSLQNCRGDGEPA